MAAQTAMPPQSVSAETHSVGVGERLSYGVGQFAEQMVFNPATSFIVFFYTDVAGIAAATAGAILLFSRILDVFNPVMGFVVDRTRTRYGKARPWLLWLAVPYGISAVLMFTAPALGPTGKIIYAFLTYNLALTFMFTALDIPYTAMLPLISSDQHQRTLLSLFRMIFSTLGGLASYAITMPMVKFFGGGAPGWQRSFIIFGAVGTVLFLVCFAGTKERIVQMTRQEAKASVKKGLASLLRNKYWLLLAGILFSLFMVIGLFGSNIYYCRYFLHNVDLFGPLMTAFQISTLVGMILVGPLLKRVGKRNAAVCGAGIVVIGQVMMYAAPHNFSVVLIGTILKGFGFAPVFGTLFAMVADSIEYGEWKCGVRNEGLTYGVMALVTRISVGLGNAMVGFILGASGYQAGADVQPASALVAMKAMFLHIPLGLALIIGLILWMYQLDKHYPSIVAELKARRSNLQGV
jgi:glycoside/pentoside/hexuronide:cation symporter, GPH family